MSTSTQTLVFTTHQISVRPLNILLAVDGSPHSSAAVKLMLELCQGCDTAITVLSVAQAEAPALGTSGVPADRMHYSDKMDLELAARRSARAFDELRAGGLNVERLTWQGPAEEVILEQASRMGADLIVVGAKGLGTPRELCLGSTAQTVVNHADCPVLVARPALRTRFSRVVLGYDGSPGSHRAAEMLHMLSLPAQTEIYVVGVADESAAYNASEPGQSPEPPHVAWQELIDSVRAKVMEGADGLSAIRTPIFRSVRVGHPAKELLGAVKETRADLIVVGGKAAQAGRTHSLGKVAQKVARYASGSVLIAR